jgi:hypothetical protein
MKTMKTALAFASMISLVSPLFAGQTPSVDKDYFTIGSEVVTLTETQPGKAAVPPAMNPSYESLAGTSKAAGGMVNAGMAAWNVINSGAPSGSYASAYASAIPGFSYNWGNITGWKGPKEMVYRYKVTNLMGVDVIDVKYKISFFYGGTEDYDGKGTSNLSAGYFAQTGQSPTRDESKIHGHYITNFTVQPVSVNVKWGWHFDLSVKMSDPMNIGTKMEPVAALQASLNWIRSTPFSTNGGTLTYNVDGLGNFTDLTQTEKEMGEPGPVQIKAVKVDWN